MKPLPAAADLLEGLVRIPSPSGEERPASAWLVGRMKEMGFGHAAVDTEGSAVGQMGDGPRVLMLLGHIDTVPGNIPVRREAGRLYGRGTVDAKGPLAAFTLAVAAAGPLPGWTVVVAGAVEEESATARGARRIASDFRPQACVIGEPSGWQRLCLGYKGRLLVDYSLTRPMSHTAGDERSACERLVEFWNRVEAHAGQMNEGRSGEFQRLSPSLRHLHSNSDGLTETASARIGLRLPPGLPVADLEASLMGLARDGASLTFAGREEAYRSAKNTPLVRAFLPAVRAAGGTPGFVVKTGTADMNVVAPIWDCPILAYGPGDSSLDHTPDEHIEIADLERAVEVLRLVIESICNEAAPGI